MSITPCLFIGLGTTGLEILTYLRRFIFETYESASLPIFKFLVIETRNDVEDKDPWLPLLKSMKVSDRIEIAKAIIEDTRPIKVKLDKNKKHAYNKLLADWLSETVLDIPGNSFINGASNIRPAGRLCLWSNWNEVANAIDNALGVIVNPSNLDRTISFLEEFHKEREIPIEPPLVENRPNVFLVGSLCGGTCGGMFIDIAYYLRQRQVGNILGIFTIMDNQSAIKLNPHSADQANKDLLNRCANSWAGLIELDFYSNGATEVSYGPFGEIEPNNDSPFDYFQVVSPSASGNIRFIDESGKIDLEQLNHMIALSIFMETLGKVRGSKEAVRTDWRATPVWGSLNHLGHVHQLSTFGLSAVLFPKTRIAAATACNLTQNLCRVWRGLEIPIDKNRIEPIAKEAWRKIREEVGADLIRPPTGSLLDEQIRTVFREQKSQLLALSSSEIWKKLQEFPVKGDSLVKRLAQGGEYFRIIENNVGFFESELNKEIGRAIAELLNLNEVRSLAEAEYFVDCLQDEITKTLNRCPLQPPPLVITQFETVKLIGIEKDIWTKLLGLKKEAEEDKKEMFIRNLEKYLLNYLEKVKMFFMRSGLEKAKFTLTERKQWINSIKGSLQKVERDCEHLFKNLISPSNWTNVRFVYQYGSIENDIKKLTESLEIKDRSIIDRAADGLQLKDFFSLNENEVLERLKDAFQTRALSLLRRVSTSKMASNISKDGLNQLVERSTPYLEYKTGFQGAQLSNIPNLLIGGGIRGELAQLANALTQNHNLRLPTGERGVIHSHLADQMVVVYQEKAAFSMDDLTLSNTGQQIYEISPGQYGHHCHKNKDYFSIQRVFEERKKREDRQRAQDWLLIAKNIFPDPFRQEGDKKLIFTYTSPSGVKRVVLLDETAAGDKLGEAFDEFKDLVMRFLKELGKEKALNQVNAYMDKLRIQKISQNDIDLVQNRVESVLKEAFEDQVV